MTGPVVDMIFRGFSFLKKTKTSSLNLTDFKNLSLDDQVFSLPTTTKGRFLEFNAFALELESNALELESNALALEFLTI